MSCRFFACVQRSKYRERLLQQSQAEDQLRQQLQMYGAKFEQFQETLQNSNKMFENFQRDLGKVSHVPLAKMG